ncbi:hypothetical protein O181_099561 [Austropuccinia psidii MF-1]|uniref:Uncharacterized protein n=1 Tax=Austropuccinia psidii MF-1 TaxID=1389203 RepID=A0A9Q3JDP3_9BASI|nr:hypothetical protein [Austropuccinia psidii MF-1]
MLAKKHTRNVHLLSAPSDHAARGVLSQDALVRTPLWSTMMKPYPSANGHRDPKQADGNDSTQLALSPQVLICPPPPPKPPSNGRRWQEDIQAWANCHHVLSSKGFKRQKQNPPNPPQQDSPIPSFLCEQTPRQPTPGPSGTRWSEELFRKPYRTEEPPIPGPSPSSQRPEDVETYHLQLVPPLPAQSLSSTIRPFDPPPLQPRFPPQCKAPLIPIMTLARSLPTYD